MTVRVRFAPSPTGFMHLGNVRAAVFNYLFARQKKGTFILRIEDTDASRNLDEAKVRILKDLEWLNLPYQEGPLKGGPHEPYLQSERNDIYQEHLSELIENCKVYRCFCTAEELEAMRQKQIAMGKPPRYNRTCATHSDDKIKLKIAAGTPFIWRFRLNQDQIFEIHDMARGKVTFEMKHFSDFALTRPDGTCTFMFVNFVDDWLMKITHVIRGEDHLSNTAMQAALYDAFAVPLPIFWHLPIICNNEGEKLSKRDFGFSLGDLQAAGFLPEAICNYIATIGISLTEEVQTMDQLVQNYNFEHLHHAGHVRYDLAKLTWFNHKWMNKIEHQHLLELAKPFLLAQHPEIKNWSDEKISVLLAKIKGELNTLHDIGAMLAFCFTPPTIARTDFETAFGKEKATTALSVIRDNVGKLENIDLFIQSLKEQAQKNGLKTKEVFGPVRYLITGKAEGVGMHDLLNMLDTQEIKKRLTALASD